MKKLFTAAAAAALAITTTPAFAKSSWVEVFANKYGARTYVLKHQWTGATRVFDQAHVGNNGNSARPTRLTADCNGWRIYFGSNVGWEPVYPGTMGDATLQYVCS